MELDPLNNSLQVCKWSSETRMCQCVCWSLCGEARQHWACLVSLGPCSLPASLTHPLWTTLTWYARWESKDGDQGDQGCKSCQQEQQEGGEAGPSAGAAERATAC